MAAGAGEHLWVVDTSSLARIRHLRGGLGATGEKNIFKYLSELVEDGILVYPAQVAEELSQYGDPGKYQPREWAKKHRRKATRYGPLFEIVDELMGNPQIRTVNDPEKGEGTDEADPHVLALALRLEREGHEVTVLTEERTDRPTKLSINTACGLLRIVCLPIEAFLVQQDVIPPGTRR